MTGDAPRTGEAEPVAQEPPACRQPTSSRLHRERIVAVPSEGRPSLRALGPGLVAAGSDNDPTTVATLVVVGATGVYSLSSVVLLLYPMLSGVLVIAAQVGLASRCGLLLTVKRLYGRGWGLLLLVSVLSVNLITLAADLEAGAASLGLLFGVDLRWFVLPYTGLLLGLLLFGSYRGIQRALKYSMALFVAYVFAAFLAHPNWSAVLRATIFPPVSLQPEYVEGALAILGTTLTSYCYVWAVQQEAEEPRLATRMAHARVDAGVGMLIAVVTFWSSSLPAEPPWASINTRSVRPWKPRRRCGRWQARSRPTSSRQGFWPPR